MKTLIQFVIINILSLVAIQVIFAQREITLIEWEGRKIEVFADHIEVHFEDARYRDTVAAHLSIDFWLIEFFDRERRLAIMYIEDDADIREVIEKVRNINGVVRAGPSVVGRTQVIPNDPYFLPYQYGPSITDMPGAWDITTGSDNIRVAVLDSGIPLNFVLPPNIPDELSHEDLSNSNRIILGEDFTEEHEDEGVRDLNGHGTHVTGILSAETNNEIGIAGSSWDNKVLVVKVFDILGHTTASDFYSAVEYAIFHEFGIANKNRNEKSRQSFVNIINFSGGFDSDPNNTIRNAVAKAHEYDVVIVAAAGNYHPVFNPDRNVLYPGAYSTHHKYYNVIAVSATDDNDVVPWWSSRGPQVSFSAPGVHIFSTTPDYPTHFPQNYGFASGTSMSAPHVAGTAALLLSVNEELKPNIIRSILQNSADKVPGMGGQDFTPEYGHGRLNAYEAIIYTIEHHGGKIGGEGRTIVFDDDLTISATLEILAGTNIIMNGSMNVTGTLIIGSNVVFTNNDEFTIAGTVNIGNNVVFTNHGELAVSPGGNLTINPGAEIKMAGGKQLTVNGKLLSNGTSSNSITLRSTTGSWSGIVLDGANGSRIHYTNIRNATSPLIVTNTNDFKLRHSTIQLFGANAVTLSEGSFGLLIGNTIEGSCLDPGGMCVHQNGINVTGGSAARIEDNNTIKYLAGAAVFASGGNVISDASNLWINGRGIYLYNANTMGRGIVNNSIENNIIGIFANGMSFAGASNYHDLVQGENEINYNVTALRAESNSEISLGWSLETSPLDTCEWIEDIYGGRNTIDYVTDYYVYAKDNAIVRAIGNDWNSGSEPPNSLLFDIKDNADVRIVPWMKDELDWPPTGGLSEGLCDNGGPPVHPLAGIDGRSGLRQQYDYTALTQTMITTRGEDDPRTQFAHAERRFLQGRYGDARPMFKQVAAAKQAEDKLRNRSLIYLSRIFNLTDHPGIIPFVRNFNPVSPAVDRVRRAVLYGMYARAGDYENSLSEAVRTKNTYPGTETEKHALIHLAFLSGYTDAMKEISEMYLDELLTKYGGEVDVAILAALGVHDPYAVMGSPGAGGIAAGTPVKTEDEDLSFGLASYPNPFNPATVIQYTIPADGRVTLKVYDILGREIATLVDDYKEAGAYDAVFDAARLPSGVYFTRIEFGGSSIVQRVMLVK